MACSRSFFILRVFFPLIAVHLYRFCGYGDAGSPKYLVSQSRAQCSIFSQNLYPNQPATSDFSNLVRFEVLAGSSDRMHPEKRL
ncbi:MAG: hypothetical protein PWP58_531 [Bacillota bacterium]|jgi:hypothetical protein|nr:hypothetical protein [Bacillota bacterium]